MRKALFPLCAVLCAAAAMPVFAQSQFAKPEDAIRYRQSAYVLMGAHMGRIAAQLKAPKPDAAAIQRSAAVIDFASQLPGEAFVAGSETGGNPPTRAKPEIFKDPRARELGGNLNEAVGKLNAAAKSGDLAAVRTAFGETGKACKACHDSFRKD